ncbi:MAG TPA: hypothetical protein VK915_02265 [Gaiellaceae bacterium]|nr:hypothetical protein [Gaiellaceae bacterium]
MLIEISDPTAVEPLRAYLQRQGLSERAAHARDGSRSGRSGRPRRRTDAQARAKDLVHVREWCSANPGVKPNLLS